MSGIVTDFAVPEDTQLAVYSPLRAVVAKIVADNKSIVFDYTTKQGQRDARSYIHTIRLSKKPIDDVRKQAKAESLEYGRCVDAQGNALIAQLDAAIEKHMQPIREIQEKEAQRIDGIREQIKYLDDLTWEPPASSDTLTALLKILDSVVVDDSYDELEDLARTAFDYKHLLLTDAIASAEKREVDEAELKQLRAESEVRAKLDNERRIKDEAAAQAKREAAAATAADQASAAAREKAARERAERAEREADEAKKRAATAAQDAENRVRREARETAEREAQEKAKREADTAHKKAINNQIVTDLIQHAGVSEQTAKMVVIALAGGKVSNTAIAY